MSLAQILAYLMGGNDAEAKQYYVSESGKVPKDIPLKFAQNSLADVLGKEPENPKEYRQLLDELFKRRMEYNASLPQEEQSTTGDILNRLNNDLLQASMAKLGVTKLQDVVPKVLTAYGVSPEEQAKMNQMYILDPTKLKPKSNFSVSGLTYPSISEPLGTGIGGLKTSKANLTNPRIDPLKVFGAPIKFRGDPDKTSPLARVRAYINSDAGSGPLEESAAVMSHELGHSLYPNFDHTLEDYSSYLPKETSLTQALEDTKFMGHFPQETLDGQPIYGLHGKVARMTHPEWFKEARKEALKQLASPTPKEEE